MSASVSQMPLPPAVDVADDAPALHETVIQASRGWLAVDWGELLRHRELLMFLVWRDIKVRYKQATLGIAWAVLQPLTQVVIFSLIFGAGFNLASRFGADVHVPYPVFIFAALLPWQFFARSMTDGGLSLINQQHLLTKIYFPRLFVPSASIGSAMFDMLISMPIFLGMLWLYHMAPNWTVVFLPLLLLATAMLAAGVAYTLAALTVTYRDFRFIIQFAVQIWMWSSFVMIPFPPDKISHWTWRVVLYANPMYGQIATYRKILISDPGVNRMSPWEPGMLVVSVAMSIAVFFFGIFYFRRTERQFADIA